MLDDLNAILEAAGRDAREVPWLALNARIERARQEGDVALLAVLLDRLGEPVPGAWSAAGSLSGSVARALALIPSLDACRALASRPVEVPSLLGAALANTQPLEHLGAVVAELSPTAPGREAVIAWLHEIVYHGHEPGQDAAVARFVRGLRESGHPLAGVPLALTEAERALDRRPAWVSPGGFGSWTIGPWPAEPPADARPAASLLGVDCADAGWIERIRRAFRPPAPVTNCEVEARRYLLDAPLDPGLLGAPALRALAPDCLTGRDEDGEGLDPASPPIGAAPCSARELRARVLHAAIGWRCYGNYAGVGPGRRHAMELFAALADCPSDASWGEIDRALEALALCVFTVASPWSQGWWETFCFLALDPSRTVLTLVAMRDTD